MLPAIIPLLLASCAMATVPLVDFDRMGTVGLAGAFAGLGIFDNSSALSFDPTTSSLLARDNSGALTKLGSTQAGGSILATCVLADTVYVAGSFSSINGTTATNVASYSSGSFSALASGGPDGPVHALYCDSTNNKVWAGGKFSSPSSAVAVYDTKAKSWSAPPFGGLTGAAAEVLSISTNSSSDSLFFAGSFLANFVGNGTAINGTNNPNVPFSSGASPFSSSLVPIPLQNASIQGEPSSSDADFSNVENILCPAGADGAGNTWLGANGNTAVITARAFESLSASGVRLGNTFAEGRSTTAFSVTTIPDNAVRTLTYLDPATQQNKTCTDACPLSTDSSVLYQDFVFADGQLSITGVQIKLSEWTGAGPGLHIFQLLSSGAFASAVASQNGASCFAPAASTTTHTGTWTEVQANTNIAGTVVTALVADVPVGTAANQAPTVTWRPYVSASGEYQINLLVPGCTEFQNCAARTSVSVSVFAIAGSDPTVTTIDESNTDDKVFNIYSGPVVPTSDDFTVAVTLGLASNPTGNGDNGKYQLVADRVQLVLTNANVTGSSGNGTGSASGTRGSFGFFEWPLSSSSNVNAEGTLPNNTETAADALGVALFTALGGNSSLSSSTTDVVSAVAHHSSGAIIVGGDFSLTSPATTHIALFKNGALSALSNSGLNGNVSSLALTGDTLFVGGAFSDTKDGSTSGKLAGVAKYDVASNTWSDLAGGLGSGAFVSSLLIDSDGALLVAGTFSGQGTDGLAKWNVSSGAWVGTGGFINGALSLVANGTSSTQLVAGSVSQSLQFGASGFATIKNGAGGAPSITPLGATLDAATSSSSTASANGTTTRRRVHSSRRVGPSAWVPHVPMPSLTNLFTRQSSSSASLPALPVDAAVSGPAVLAGAFYTNSSNSRQIIVLGGNFTSGSAQNIGFYDQDAGSLNQLNGAQPNGVVRALFVHGDQLFVGGQFSLALDGGNADGFAVYDLSQGKWVQNIQTLTASNGGNVMVRSITGSNAKGNAVFVAGSFAGAGNLACAGICEIAADTKQWNALGNGIQGEVGAVDYAGNDQQYLVAAGSLALSGSSTPAYVLQFAIDNSTWTALGNSDSLAGPVTAVAVNDLNTTSIFAAGRSSSADTSYLSFYDGSSWTPVASTLGASNISQLSMVPLQDGHGANAILQDDRMLMLSGTLDDTSFGQASMALFDGASLIPYMNTAGAGGAQGSMSGLFHSQSTFSFSLRHLLATGIVILISIAIAAGVVFLLVLAGVLWTLFARRDDALGAKYADEDDASDRDSAGAQHRPSSLLAHINAATRGTIVGALGVEKARGAGGEEHEMSPTTYGGMSGEPDGSNYLRAETPNDAMAGLGMGEDEPGRAAHARYSFDGAGEGELPLSVGMELEVLDDRDHSWWYARDLRTGQEGVVPAAYLY
ncbi:hypothetical protein PENSPDRAFT_658902 [Peniophora sp. CONT]|nr:hypothetical protein PENSPDRAFT_658902 [Peniophora sp. CONT]